MKNIRLLIAATLLSTVPLTAGCDFVRNVGNVTTAVSTPPCDHTLNDERARWAAEALYNVPAAAYRSANERGLFEGRADLKAQIREKLQLMGGYLRGVRAAHEVCDTATLLSYKAGMEKLQEEVLPLIPGRS